MIEPRDILAEQLTACFYAKDGILPITRVEADHLIAALEKAGFAIVQNNIWQALRNRAISK